MCRLQNDPHHGAHVFSVQGWRWSVIEKYFVCHVLTYFFSFDAGAGVVLGGEWPEKGSASPGSTYSKAQIKWSDRTRLPVFFKAIFLLAWTLGR